MKCMLCVCGFITRGCARGRGTCILMVHAEARLRCGFEPDGFVFGEISNALALEIGVLCGVVLDVFLGRVRL